ncbi:DUF5005 domain-containing protein [Sunxiuqinia sp. A32]|uniref:DUF5005 domain-containing protein n=1 Tax=Sunxiuqinia sp. A32 TaxID=3461496 RepID=UPI004045229F
MNLQIKSMILLGIILSMLISCKDDDGTNLRPNIFNEDNENSTLLSVKYTSNADSVILTWELLTDTVTFDHFQVSEEKSNKIVQLGHDDTKCILTHFPYQELVPISISFMKNEKAINTYTLNVMIDGLDTIFAHTLIPDRGSVTGGDGTYSIALPDGRSIFLMGDSFIGPVTDGARSMQDHMFRNTYILYDEGQVSGIYNANGDKTSAAVPPGVTDEGQKWYWPGHGFVNDNKLYIFQTLMYQGEAGMWGFRYEKTDILEYNLPNIELVQTVDIPFQGSPDIHYGMAALKEDDYVYIYAQVDIENGLNTISDVLVARTTMEDLYTKWEYFDGSGWSQNSSDAVKLEGLSSVPVSSQFNVFKLNGKYVLLTQKKQFLSGEIYTFIADSPQGPWYNKQLIYNTQEQNTPDIFTYNAMAHPQFTKDGMILISYNINNGDFVKQHEDVSTYRPKFFWVEIDKILNN